jgi:hypothetical protein
VDGIANMDIKQTGKDYSEWFKKADDACPKTFLKLFGQKYTLEQIEQFAHNYAGGGSYGEEATWEKGWRKDVEEYFKTRLIEVWLT